MQQETQEYYKEGKIEGDIGAILTLVVGVGAAVLVLVFVGTLGGRLYNIVEPDLDAIGQNSVANEGFTALNSTAVSLNNNPIHQGSLVITNLSNNVGLGNFTVDYSAGTVTLTNNAYNNTALNATYDWGNKTVPSHVKNSIISGFNALEDTGSYLPLIVIAVVIVFILGMIMTVMMMNNGKGGSGKFAAL